MIYAGAIQMGTGEVVLLLLLLLILLAVPVLAVIGLGVLGSGLYQRHRSAPAADARLADDAEPSGSDRWEPDRRHHDARVAADRGRTRIVIGLCLMGPCVLVALRFLF